MASFISEKLFYMFTQSSKHLKSPTFSSQVETIPFLDVLEYSSSIVFIILIWFSQQMCLLQNRSIIHPFQNSLTSWKHHRAS